MDELINLIDSGVFKNLFDVFVNWEEPVPLNSEFTYEIAVESPILVLAHQNLNKTRFKFVSDLIDYSIFYYYPPFLEWVYSMYLGRQLTSEDVLILFRSNIPEKIALNLLDFDTTQSKAEITPEFFQNLRNLTWENNKIEGFYTKIQDSIRSLAFEHSSIKVYSFFERQRHVIWFLAGCSAVKNGKGVIGTEDIILAYRTLFKIIKTDISKLIEEPGP